MKQLIFILGIAGISLLVYALVPSFRIVRIRFRNRVIWRSKEGV